MSNENIKRYTLEQVRALKSETDWDALRAAGPYEGPQEFEVDWSKARIGLPEPKAAVSIRLDPDVLGFFKSQGKGYQTRINAVLRAYMEAKQSGQA